MSIERTTTGALGGVGLYIGGSRLIETKRVVDLFNLDLDFEEWMTAYGLSIGALFVGLAMIYWSLFLTGKK